MSKTFLIENGDVAYDTSGTTKTTEGKVKLRQDLGEMLAIEIQPDGFGAGIAGVIGNTDFDDGMESNLEFVLRERMQGASERFMLLQKRSIQNRPLEEQVRRIVFMDAAQSATDPTLYRWKIDYETQNGAIQTLRGRLGA